MRKAVLVVDDDPVLRGSIRALFERMGHEVIEAADGAAALAALAVQQPSLICLDLVLPESSGYDVCDYIRASPAHSATPVIAMSDRTYPEDRAQAAEAGAAEFLAKPFALAQLQATVERLLHAGPMALAS